MSEQRQVKVDAATSAFNSANGHFPHLSHKEMIFHDVNVHVTKYISCSVRSSELFFSPQCLIGNTFFFLSQ